MNIIGGYVIDEIINKGSFGIIYKCRCYDSRSIYAMKVGKNLKHEANVCKVLLNQSNVSTIIYYFKYKNIYDCVVFKLYEQNLKQYKENYFYDKDYITYLKVIFKGVLVGIENIHNLGLVHRDIKPVNICLDNKFEPYIIDFGMTKQIIKNKKHIELGNINDIIGTINYASINSINKIELSRRDDIESLFFVFMYMILNDSFYNNYINNNIYDQKKIITIENYVGDNNAILCISYIRRMTFTQKPNYAYIHKLLFESSTII